MTSRFLLSSDDVLSLEKLRTLSNFCNSLSLSIFILYPLAFISIFISNFLFSSHVTYIFSYWLLQFSLTFILAFNFFCVMYPLLFICIIFVISFLFSRLIFLLLTYVLRGLLPSNNNKRFRLSTYLFISLSIINNLSFSLAMFYFSKSSSLVSEIQR